MIWDYAPHLLILAIAANAFSRKGIGCALSLAGVSMLFGMIIQQLDGPVTYVAYTIGQISLVYLYFIVGRERICYDMAQISLVGAIVQLVGIGLWALNYGDNELYMTLTEAVFVVEIGRLVTNGIVEGMAGNRELRIINYLRRMGWVR